MPLCAQRRISQPKFFKPYRGFADSLAKRKSQFVTMTYAWRTKRYSNRLSGWAKFPFEISAEFRATGLEMAVGENLPHLARPVQRAPNLRLSRIHAHAGGPCQMSKKTVSLSPCSTRSKCKTGSALPPAGRAIRVARRAASGSELSTGSCALSGSSGK